MKLSVTLVSPGCLFPGAFFNKQIRSIIMDEIKVTKKNGSFKNVFKKFSSENLYKLISYKVQVQGGNTTVVFSPQKGAEIDQVTFNNIVSQLLSN